jgi:hypothetical protein
MVDVSVDADKFKAQIQDLPDVELAAAQTDAEFRCALLTEELRRRKTLKDES